MKYSLVTLVVLGMAAGQAQADVSLDQSGTNNQASLDQTGANTMQVNQGGLDGRVAVSQNGGNGNTITVDQFGDLSNSLDQLVNVSQTDSQGSDITLGMSGDSQAASLQQQSVLSSSIGVQFLQPSLGGGSSFNDVQVLQQNTDSSNVFVDVAGVSNVISVTQAGTFASQISIGVDASNNNIAVIQETDDSNIGLTVTGDDNDITLSQRTVVGSSNIAINTSGGVFDFDLDTDGPITVDSTVDGEGNAVTVQQTGEFNEFGIVQDGADNSIAVSSNVDGLSFNAQQQGDNNGLAFDTDLSGGLGDNITFNSQQFGDNNQIFASLNTETATVMVNQAGNGNQVSVTVN